MADAVIDKVNEADLGTGRGGGGGRGGFCAPSLARPRRRRAAPAPGRAGKSLRGSGRDLRAAASCGKRAGRRGAAGGAIRPGKGRRVPRGAARAGRAGAEARAGPGRGDAGRPRQHERRRLKGGAWAEAWLVRKGGGVHQSSGRETSAGPGARRRGLPAAA